MKQRVISAVVGLAILLAVLTFFNTIYFNIIALIAYGIVLTELYNAFKEKNTKLISVLLAAAGVYFMLPPYYNFIHPMIFAAISMFGMAATVVFGFKDVDFRTVSANIMFGIYVLIGFYAVLYLKQLLPYEQYGYDSLFLFVLCLVIAWGSDVFAYFAGYFFGKNKLAPNLSPKKTIEGFIGGLVGASLLTMLLIKLYQVYKPVLEGTDNTYTISAKFVICALIIAITGGAISVIGDLFASAVKRQVGIKDYGKIMPGHGGILDRFDSVIILSPIICGIAYFVAELGGIFFV